MTREQIAAGLELLALQLANDPAVPDGWTAHEWAYVKGIASGEMLRLRDRLVGPGTRGFGFDLTTGEGNMK